MLFFPSPIDPHNNPEVARLREKVQPTITEPAPWLSGNLKIKNVKQESWEEPPKPFSHPSSKYLSKKEFGGKNSEEFHPQGHQSPPLRESVLPPPFKAIHLLF